MKKNMLLLGLCLLVQISYAQNMNFSFGPEHYQLEPYQEKVLYVLYDDVFIGLSYISPTQLDYREENYNNFIQKIKINEDSGYLYTNYESLIGKEKYSFTSYLIQGKGILIVSERYKPINKTSLTDAYKKNAENYLNRKYNSKYKGSECEEWGQVISIPNNIKKIKSSSFLEETNTSYNPENLISKIDFSTSDEEISYSYDSFIPPWVDGVKGYGVDEWLEIEFKSKSNEFQILNGFVDFGRPYLYKENSRVKKILVESESPKFVREYELEDVVKYNLITLPETTDKIKITIKDVYKGDKYDDTCLSSIIVTDLSEPSFDAEKNLILDFLKDKKLYKRILNLKNNK